MVIAAEQRLLHSARRRRDEAYLGVDLHRTQFTVCTRLENGRTYLRQWPLRELKLFAAQLRKEDEIAVESTGNTRLFHDAVVERCGARGGGQPEPVQGDQPVGEEDRQERCRVAGAVSLEGIIAGGADERTQAKRDEPPGPDARPAGQTALRFEGQDQQPSFRRRDQPEDAKRCPATRRWSGCWPCR